MPMPKEQLDSAETKHSDPFAFLSLLKDAYRGFFGAPDADTAKNYDNQIRDLCQEAREYNIPAVVGTWNATNSINDGDIIKIDGNVGIVEVIERAKTP